MNRRLPQFYGEPTKWQMYDSAFVYSTKSCGLMNHENVSRLMDSLHGDAMNAVKSRLLHPDSVPGVMETLRLMYGRPELVIQSLLEEINETTPPKSDDLGSLIKFSIAVKNLCSTIETYGADNHLRNPNLIKALTDKLPSQIQLNWAFYKHQIRDVNVSILGNWLYELATVASDVVTVNPYKVAKSSKYFINVQLDDDYANDSNDNDSNSSMDSVDSDNSHSSNSNSSTHSDLSSRSCTENSLQYDSKHMEEQLGLEDLVHQTEEHEPDIEHFNELILVKLSDSANGVDNVGND